MIASTDLFALCWNGSASRHEKKRLNAPPLRCCGNTHGDFAVTQPISQADRATSPMTMILHASLPEDSVP